MSLAEFKALTHVHVIGIGGIGISAVARLLLDRGVVVTGSDRSVSKVTQELSKAGAKITEGHVAENIPPNCQCVLYTVAIPEDNPELIEAQKRNIQLLTYPQTLNFISQEKYTIAISGTHGKTTTTAMVAKVLIDAGLDPTVIIGSLFKRPDGSESNYIAGKSKYLVVEADEYKKSFHNLHPSILVTTNIDEDHLDFYKDLADIQDSFKEVAKKLPVEGFFISNTTNPHVSPVVLGLGCNIIDYSKIELHAILQVPGNHNKENARAALAVAKALGVSLEAAEKSLSEFTGVWRRFEYKGTTKNGVLVYDDYAHNPQKVAAALAGVREQFPDKKITVVFQPHLYSRTKSLFDQFSKAFTEVDRVIFVPIYAARESHDEAISSDMLSEAVNKVKNNSLSLTSFSSAEEYLRHSLQNGEVLMTVGAGDVYKIGESLLREK